MFARLRIKIFEEESGQSAILVAIFITLLLGITAFTADAGYLFYQRRNMQNAADAAALAGAREFIDGDVSKIDKVVEDYVKAHRIDLNDIVDGYPLVDGDYVTVELRGTRPLFFAQVFGLNDASVPARATAAAGHVTEFMGGGPFFITKEKYDEIMAELDEIDGNEFELYAKFEAGQSNEIGLHGNWGTVNFEGPGSPDKICTWLANGYDGTLSADEDDPSIIYTAPSVRLNACYETLLDLADAKAEFIIPVIAPLDEEAGYGSGSTQVKVVHFAKIRIDRVSERGQIEIESTFLKPTDYWPVSGPISMDPEDESGLKGVALVE